LATRESAIAVHMAVARLFLPLARDLSKRTGTPWPDALESALRAHLDSQLGLKLPDLSPWRPTAGAGDDANGNDRSPARGGRHIAAWHQTGPAQPATATVLDALARAAHASQQAPG
jgi:hypothetical protein